MQVSSIEEINQSLAELRQTINTAFEERDFCVSMFPQVAQRHYIDEVEKQVTIR